MKHTITDLYQMQGLPLSAKIKMTERRITEWVEEFGEDGVYVSFSGGKDSTVLLHLVRKLYPSVKAVFVDTGLEYPEIREFVKSFDNVDWLRPKMNFKQVIEKYGYPFISKEVSECVYGARRYVKKILGGARKPTNNNSVNYVDLMSIKEKSRGGQTASTENSLDLANMPIRTAKILGCLTQDNKIMENIPSGDKSMYSQVKYKFFLEAPFEISSMCCNVMKKQPTHSYAKKTGRMPMTAQMTSESRLRTQQWLKNGCNGFHMKSPISNPMSFWTEQDVLLYIKENNLPIASIYGDVVVDYESEGQVNGQMSMAEMGLFDKDRRLLKTTGVSRTGCMFCGYGCHLESSPNRFERMKQTHPKQYDFIMKPRKECGLGFKEVIDWINENGNMNIKY